MRCYNGMAPCKTSSRSPAPPSSARHTPSAYARAPFSAFTLAPIDIPQEVWATPYIPVLGLILTGIVFGLLGVWLKEREVATRIAGLDASIEGIKTVKGAPHHLLAVRSDPVSRFVDEVNLVLGELEHSRRDLQESRDRYRLLFESGNDFLLVCAVGREGTPYRILDANALACRCLGYTRDELFALTPGSVIIVRSDFKKGNHHLHSANLIPGRATGSPWKRASTASPSGARRPSSSSPGT